MYIGAIIATKIALHFVTQQDFLSLYYFIPYSIFWQKRITSVQCYFDSDKPNIWSTIFYNTGIFNV